jgi:hypothetical protein
MSDARQSKWPNTLEAQRRQKENWKIEKLEREEQERQQIDREEAELQKRLRIEAIKRANTILYEQTDKMKGLRSAQMFTDVIADREEQVAERCIKKKWTDERGGDYYFVMMQQLAEANKKEEEEVLARKAKYAEMSTLQQAQLADIRVRYIERLKQEKLEGELILLKSQQEVQEDAEKAAERMLQARMAAEEMQLANQSLKKLQLEMSLKEEEENQYRQAQLKKKEDLALQRKEMEARRFAEKQAVRQRMIDRACEELAAKAAKDDQIELKQAKEARDKEDADMAMRNEKRRRQREAIDRSRELQIRLKEEKNKMETEEAAQMVADYKVKIQEMEEEDFGERMAVRNKNLEMRASHEAQVAEKREWLHAERNAQLRADAQTRAVFGEDEERYKKMAEEVMNKAEAEGKNTRPIYKALYAKEIQLLPATTSLRV